MSKRPTPFRHLNLRPDYPFSAAEAEALIHAKMHILRASAHGRTSPSGGIYEFAGELVLFSEADLPRMAEVEQWEAFRAARSKWFATKPCLAFGFLV